jgi:DNA modification methylase
VTPYYDDGKGIVIYNGDNVATMREAIPDGSIDLVVTSPPYDNLRTYGGHQWDFEGVAAELWRVIKPGGVVVWVVADATIDGSETGTSFRQALRFIEIGFRLHDTMIWDKDGIPARGSNAAYLQSSEFMFVFCKGPLETSNLITDRANKWAGATIRQYEYRRDGERIDAGSRIIPDVSRRTNVWRICVGDKVDNGHPAAFPEALARDHILSWSNEGDTVLDPFGGSGTTAKMAKLMGRKSISVEINQGYCEIQVERLRQGVLDFGGDV